MKFSIKFKFMLFTSLLILVIGVGSGVYFGLKSRKMLEDSLKKLGLSFVVQFSMDEDVRNALYLEQSAFLDTPIIRLKELDLEKELAYCRILLPSGKVFREEKEDWVMIDMDDVSNVTDVATVRVPQVNSFFIRKQNSMNNSKTIVRASDKKGSMKDTIFDFISPVFDKKGIEEEELAEFLGQGKDSSFEEQEASVLGYVQIGLSSVQITKKLWKILLTGIIPLSLVTILGGVWVLYSIARKIAKPVLKLVKMTERIAKGDLEYKVDFKSSDEIGILARSFNQMTNELKLQRDDNESVMARLKEVNIQLENSNIELKKTNEQLKDAQDKIIRSEKLAAVGQLASSVAHELRTPIGAIKNSIFFIKRKIRKEPKANIENVADLLKIVENESERSTKIVSNLLGFTQTSKPSVAPTNVRYTIDETIKRLNTPNTVSLINKVEYTLPDVLIDSAQIEQVFLNIMQNSYQAMPKGGELKITANVSDKFINIQFSDTGTGIQKKFIKKIFDPLFTTKTDGIGLGLAFSYGVIKRHGGDIDVKSEEGKGAVFVVSLPKSIDS